MIAKLMSSKEARWARGGENESEMFGDKLGVDGSQVGVFEEGDDVSFGGWVSANYDGWMVTCLA